MKNVVRSVAIIIVVGRHHMTLGLNEQDPLVARIVAKHYLLSRCRPLIAVTAKFGHFFRNNYGQVLLFRHVSLIPFIGYLRLKLTRTWSFLSSLT